MREMRELLDGYSERVLIGEVYLPIHRLVAYYGTAQNGAHLPFNFLLISLPWNAQQIAAAIGEYEGALPVDAWPNWVLGNHDQPRIASRVGLAQARVAAMLLLTLRGTPTLVLRRRDWHARRRHPAGGGRGSTGQERRAEPRSAAHSHAMVARAWRRLQHGQAVAAALARATRAATWSFSVAIANSMLGLYRRLIELRRSSPALSVGTYTPVAGEGDLLSYLRVGDGQTFMVVLNLGHAPRLVQMAGRSGKVVLATDPEREGELVTARVALLGDDGLVILLDEVEPTH